MAETDILNQYRSTKVRRPQSLIAVVLLVIALLGTTGCSSTNWVTLRSTPYNPLSEQLMLLSKGGPRPTDRTTKLLRRYDLASNSDYKHVLAQLEQLIVEEPSAEKLYCYAELAYIAGKKAELTSPEAAIDYYGASVTHAYMYLFEPRFGALRNPYDPQFRGACDLYNGALESALRLSRNRGKLLPGENYTIKAANHEWDVQIVVRGDVWKAEDFEHFEFVTDYEVNGLQNRHTTYGLGVPLVAIRKQKSAQDPSEKFYPPKLSFPVTAFLRLIPDAPGANPTGTKHRALLELHDPLVSPNIVVANRNVPLQSDISLPLAYFLNDPSLNEMKLSTAGLLSPNNSQLPTGIYMLEPYQPHKIPVVMVHGLWSTPITWMEMFNDLRSQPELRNHFQFWFYMYPSGQPFWQSAAQMRHDLADLRNKLDPHRSAPALEQMVLVGHSMGGLVSKLQTLDSGNDFWGIVSHQPFEQVKASPEIKQGLEEIFFFQPNHAIRRVVTIGTPHRGSKFANSATRWLGSKLIELPAILVQSKQQLQRDNPGMFREEWNLMDVPTSIDSLAPESPFLPVMLQAHHAPWVKYHNIIGRVPSSGFITRVSGEGDGVVEITSATLEDAESEILVEADHSVIHRHPLSVLEVQRILLEHLDDLRWPKTASHHNTAHKKQRPTIVPLYR